MYTEEFDKKQFPFRDFLLKLILVIIFVFLLVWLLPKFIAPSTNNVVDLSPLTSQIFGDNLDKMKNAAITYYTEERLPEEIGDSRQMSLREMIAQNLVIPLVDKNGKACDVDASYVKITKYDTEYILKVNLKCSDQEDYILVHLGCYNYCDSGICEKQVNVAYTESKPTTKVPVNNNEQKPDPTPDNPTQPPKPEDPTPTPTPDPPKDETLVYEYKKTTGAKLSEWTKWSAWQENNERLKSLNCNDSDPSCVKKIQLYSRKEQIGTYKNPYKVSRNEIRQVGSYKEIACSNYNYVRIDETTYQTDITTTYTTWSQVTTASSAGSWIFDGYTDGPHADTATVKYKLVDADLGHCSTSCTTQPTFKYARFRLAGGMSNVTASGSPSTSVLTSSNTTQNVNTTIKATCTATTTKVIPIYRTITTYDIAYRHEPLYGTVEYYSVKTRNVISSGKTDIKWSEYNDKSLLNAGYVYTGNTKKK